jgi:hypothetical protein
MMFFGSPWAGGHGGTAAGLTSGLAWLGTGVRWGGYMPSWVEMDHVIEEKLGWVGSWAKWVSAQSGLEERKSFF